MLIKQISENGHKVSMFGIVHPEEITFLVDKKTTCRMFIFFILTKCIEGFIYNIFLQRHDS